MQATFLNYLRTQWRVGAPLSNYDGKIAAVVKAARRLETIQTPYTVVFLINCQTTNIALTTNTPTDCHRTLEGRRKLEALQTTGWAIVLQLVPSHVGFVEKEKADKLAKQSLTLR